MALDRQSIEKNDFPTGSHGYDPEAVSAHLSALADEVAEFKSQSRRRTEHMAASASDQVRAIIEAAEASAAEIQRAAEAEAEEIRQEAHHEAQATRDQAEDQVREHVGRVSDATSAMLNRLEGMESELAELLDTLRGGAGRLDADLRELGSELEQAAQAVKPPARAEFQPDPPPAPEPVAPPPPEPVAPAHSEAWGSSTSSTADWSASEPPAPADPATGAWDSGAASPGWGAPEPAPAEPAPVEGMAAAHAHEPPTYEPPIYDPEADEHGSAPAGWPAHESAAPSPVDPGAESFPDASAAPPGGFATAPFGEGSSGSFGDHVSAADTRHESSAPQDEGDDSEGARLIALNMALNGTPREETSRYLSENFQLSDRDGLLDEVYASVEG